LTEKLIERTHISAIVSPHMVKTINNHYKWPLLRLICHPTTFEHVGQIFGPVDIDIAM